MKPVMDQRWIIFGVGEAGVRAHSWLIGSHRGRLLCFVDNDVRKQGTAWLGHPVVSPEEIPRMPCDIVVIASMHYEAIARQLIRDIGLPPEKIQYSPEIYILRAQALCRDGKRETAEAVAEETGRLYGPDYARLVWGEMALFYKDWNRVIEQIAPVLNKSVNMIPPRGFVCLARAFLHTSALGAAAATVEQGLARYPDSLWLLVERADVDVARGDGAALTQRVSRILAIHRSTLPAAVYRRLAKACYRCLCIECAEEVIDQGLARFPDDATLRIEHAEGAMTVNDWVSAVKRWRLLEARMGRPIPLNVHVRLSKAYRSMGDHEQAGAVAREGIACYPKDPRGWYEYARVAMSRSDWSCAEERWRKGLEQADKGQRGIALFQVGTCLERMGKQAQAIRVAYQGLQATCAASELKGVLQRIRRAFSRQGMRVLSSEYSGCSRGMLNRGFWSHRVVSGGRSYDYLTKIVSSEHVGAEGHFYRSLLTEEMPLARHVPRFIHYTTGAARALHFITLERVPGHSARLGDLHRILDLYPCFLRVPPERVAAVFRPPASQGKSPVRLDTLHGLSILFARVCEPSVQDVLARMLDAACTRHGFTQQTRLGVARILERVRTRCIRPSGHPDYRLSLIHGDLHKGNILVGPNHDLRIIDWSHASVGPYGYDLALLFASFRLGWIEICRWIEQYPHLFASNGFSDYLLFIQALIAAWVLFLDPLPMAQHFFPPDNVESDIQAAVAHGLELDLETGRPDPADPLGSGWHGMEAACSS